LLDRAATIRAADGRALSIADRVKLVGALPADVTLALEDYSATVNDYGVNEYIRIKCKGCGAEVRTRVSISASTFLRPGG
jgi:hypothetical protein